MAEFVRTGLASDRERVDEALGTIGKSLVEIGSGEDASGQLAISIKNVRSALDTAVTATMARRDKEAALIQAGKGVEAGFTSLAQASTKSPERDTLESISAIGAESTHALLALQRYASTGDIAEAQALQSSTATLKDGLKGVQKSTAGMTPRLVRIIGTVTASLDELPPAMDAFGGAWVARSTSLVQMAETAEQARTAIAERQVKLAAQRTAQQAEIASARGRRSHDGADCGDRFGADRDRIGGHRRFVNHSADRPAGSGNAADCGRGSQYRRAGTAAA